MTGQRPNPPVGHDAPPRLSRRRFLAAAGGATVLAPLGRQAPAGAGAASGHATTPAGRPVAAALKILGRTALRLLGSLPEPGLPAATDTLPGIDHIVILMLENHSYDNLLGMLGRGAGQTPRGDGFTIGSNGLPTATNPYGDGRIQHAFHMPTTCQLPGTPSQEWTTSHVAHDNGSNDGFVRAPLYYTS